MNKITAIIIEDEISTLEYLQMIVEDCGLEVMGAFQDYDKALNAIDKNKPDLVLVDIDLGSDKTGLDLAEKIKWTPSIIFITSHTESEVVQRAKRLKPHAYLSKPFKVEDLRIAIEMAVFNDPNPVEELDSISTLNDSLFIRNINVYIRLRFHTIRWLKAEGAYTEIQTADKKFVVRNILKKVEAQLPNTKFLRIHRSHVVNVDAITAINHSQIYIDGEGLPISRSLQAELINRINLLSSSDPD